MQPSLLDIMLCFLPLVALLVGGRLLGHPWFLGQSARGRCPSFVAARGCSRNGLSLSCFASPSIEAVVGGSGGWGPCGYVLDLRPFGPGGGAWATRAPRAGERRGPSGGRGFIVHAP